MKNLKLFAIPLVLAFLALTVCEAQTLEVDQIAQQKMIGLSKKAIRACMGLPAKRVSISSTEIWTYATGKGEVGGFFLASGANGMARFGSPTDRFCNVNIVMTNAVVSQVTYSAPDGGELPLGEQCVFAVQNCVGQ